MSIRLSDLRAVADNNNTNCMTFNPAKFEKAFRQPDEGTKGFERRVATELEPYNLCVCFGNNATLVVADSDFHPVSLERRLEVPLVFEDELIRIVEQDGVRFKEDDAGWFWLYKGRTYSSEPANTKAAAARAAHDYLIANHYL